MSGHSHAKTVKRTKEAGDKKRSQIFSKMSNVIWLAAKEAGPNPETNSKLKLALEMARSANMPKENIERAIKRAMGETPGEKLEEVFLEAYGPGHTAIIIEGITDNKNRTLSEIKQILSQHNGKLANEGSVKWMFEKKGSITINSKFQTPSPKLKEELELLVIEAGAEDLDWQGDVLNIYTKPEQLEQVKKILETENSKIESVSLVWLAKEKLLLEEKATEACQKLFEALDQNEAVQAIYSNINLF